MCYFHYLRKQYFSFDKRTILIEKKQTQVYIFNT